MPRWVPVLIGIVLVLMAALAVFTGLRYRGGPLGRAFGRAVAVVPSEGGAPGEPQPGASRVLHGAAGDQFPRAKASEADDNQSQVVISGGADGTIPTIRLSAQRAMRIGVEPADALIYVNDQPIGTAVQLQSPDLYEFPEEGEYAIRIEAAGYEVIEYIVEVDQSAPTEIAVIDTKLKRRPR